MRQITILIFAAATILLTNCRKNEFATNNIPTYPTTPRAVSPTGDVVGKIIAGYQGWFQAAADGGPFNSWQHTNLECWPDMRQYTKNYGSVRFNQDSIFEPPFTGTLGNGQPVTMFSDWDQSSVSLHFLWMQKYEVDYQVDIYPGTSFFNTNKTKKNIIPRQHGDFMWTQFAAARTTSVPSVYISMFDEMNEATGILPCAEDSSMIPSGQYFLTLDCDGTHVSADFYLRLTLLPTSLPHPPASHPTCCPAARSRSTSPRSRTPPATTSNIPPPTVAPTRQ